MRTHSSAFEDLKVIEKTVLQYDCAYYICDVSSIYVFEINVKAVDVIFFVQRIGKSLYFW